MNIVTPIPQIVPENAPFSTEQRAWLNGFFAAYLGVADSAAADEAAEPAEPEDHPWHDAALTMAERLDLAKGAKPERQLMAAMAQLDCGQCGYLCQTYAEAVWSGAEADLGRCVPGGKETQRKIKELVAALEPLRSGSAVAAPALKPAAQVGFSRDRPALATLVDAHPLNRPGSAKDVRHVVLDLSASDVTYEAGDSLGVFAARIRSSCRRCSTGSAPPARRWSASITRRCRCGRPCLARSTSPGRATSACCSSRTVPSTARKP